MLVCQLGIFVERVTPVAAIKCDCYDMTTLRNTGFTPLFKFLGLKIKVALFLNSVSTPCDLPGVIWRFS